jgi:hypothetical protein
MSSTTLARLRAARLSTYRVMCSVREFDRRAGIFDRARWPIDYCDALTLARRGL